MRIGILGPLTVAGDTSGQVTGDRPRVLLAMLAWHAGERVAADRLIAALWPEGPPANPANALQALVSRLRRTLGAATIAVADGGYRLVGAEVDTALFEALVAKARATEADASAALFEEALDLWRGPALVDLAGVPGASAETVRLEEARLAALEEYAEACLAAGQGPRAVARLGSAVAERPTRESLTARYIRALNASGRQAEALETYEQVRRALAGELGVDPGPELAAAHLEVLRAPGNLPHPITSFVGRDRDLDRLAALLGEGSRLVTLTGPGGAGKTRLAIEAARRATSYTNGAWLVELAPVADAGDVAEATATALGARDSLIPHSLAYQGVRDDVNAVDRLIASIGARRMLLVLDNCEHVIDGAARFADRLLAGCPLLTVLATSREPLGITGEALHPVSSLDTSDAVRLLRDRAGTAAPGLDADDTDLARIAARLDGMPLAIELAAPRLRTLTPAELADRLDDRFALLDRGSRTALPRHQTLRAVVAWSWDLLDDAEREYARRLAVFAGAAEPRAVEAVCGPGSADMVASLVDKSIVEITGDGRFRMLETIRAYAAERLADAGDESRWRRRHAEYFQDFAVAAIKGMRTSEQLSWLHRFAAHSEELTTALRWFIEGRHASEALRLGAALCDRWWSQGQIGQCSEWSRQILTLADADPPPGLAGAYAMCVFCAEAEVIISSLGDRERLAASHGRFAKAVSAAEHEGTAPAILLTLSAAIEVLVGEVDSAHQRLDRYLRMPDPWLVAGTHMMRAHLLLEYEHDEPSAVRELEKAVDGFARLGDRFWLSQAAFALASQQLRRGRRAELARTLSGLEAIAVELKGLTESIYLYLKLGELHMTAGDLEAARGDLARAEALLTPSTPPGGLTSLWWLRGELLRLSGEPKAAVAEYRRLQSYLLASDPLTGSVACSVHSSLGRTHVALGEAAEAHREFALALHNVLPQLWNRVLPRVVYGLMLLALSEDDAERAAWLLGVAEALDGPDFHGAEVDAAIPVVAERLGVEAYERSRAAGRAACADGPPVDAESAARLLGLGRP